MFDQIYTGEAYLKGHPDWGAMESTWKAGEVQRLLTRVGRPYRTVLDFGCGAGAILAALEKTGPADATYLGFDISPHALARASVHAGPRLRFTDRDPLADPATRFDVVLLLDILEHLENPFALLRRVRETAGTVVIHFPLDLSVSALLRPWALPATRRTLGHIHSFTVELARAFVEEAGLRVVDAHYTMRPGHLRRQVLGRLVAGPRRLAHAVAPAWGARLIGGFSWLVLAEPADRPPAQRPVSDGV